MKYSEELVFSKITDIFKKVFNMKKINISRETTANDIKGWDSLKHVQVVYEIEKEFNIKFELSEIVEMTSVGDISDAVIKKLNK